MHGNGSSSILFCDIISRLQILCKLICVTNYGTKECFSKKMVINLIKLVYTHESIYIASNYCL